MLGAKAGEVMGRFHVGMLIRTKVLYPRQDGAVCDVVEDMLDVGVLYGYIDRSSFKSGDCRAEKNRTYVPQS
eukprot:12750-Eustigmatos_ZCMA.PRE.1